MLKARIILCAIAAVAALGAGGTASADGHSCTSLQTVAAEAYYVDVRDDVPVNPINIWIYEESNGIAGLQKGGAGDESCAELDGNGRVIPPDTVVF